MQVTIKKGFLDIDKLRYLLTNVTSKYHSYMHVSTNNLFCQHVS